MKKENRYSVLKRTVIGYSAKEERDAQKKARLERQVLLLARDATAPRPIRFFLAEEEKKRRYTKRKALVSDLKI